jgi:hypothetical protein
VQLLDANAIALDLQRGVDSTGNHHPTVSVARAAIAKATLAAHAGIPQLPPGLK